MEDKRILYIIIAVIIVILILASALGLFFLMDDRSENLNQSAANQAAGLNVNTGGFLSPTLGTLPENSAEVTLEKLAREKQFISSYYQLSKTDYQAQARQYQLPINNIKETVANYRDFSRKIALEQVENQLSANGFIALSNPFGETADDWQNSYTLIKENNLPLFITADSILGVYQNTTQTIYKEIEKDFFYPSMWNLVSGLYDQAKKRYEVKKQKFGIETDLTAEAGRLEMAYLAVALQLLQPETSQIKEVIGIEKESFSPQEAETYSFRLPDYLKTEVTQEIALINQKPKAAKSAIFLYQKDYSQYQIPANYQISEKLKNYYLTITWLKNNIFPLWSKADGCADCLLDEQDYPIHFLAGLYLTQDLSKNQTLKNRWANIYKTISFFQGLETNLTYLNYNQILEDRYGADYDLDEIFSTDLDTAKKNIKEIQQALAALSFSKLLDGDQNSRATAGLRLLRNKHLLEDSVFSQLTGSAIGRYLDESKDSKDLPFTACSSAGEINRCWPSGLDLFNLIENKTAQDALIRTRDNRYQNYQSKIKELNAEIKKFDQNTWHDNSYLATLSALQTLNSGNLSGFPTFMQTKAWGLKTLNTDLAALVDAKKEISLEKTELRQTTGLKSYAGNYGYVEPQIEFYNQLLANVKMIKNGFTNLGIIANTDKTFDRLTNLESILAKAIAISKKELTNETLAVNDYDFINDFDNLIKSVIGDIKEENRQNIYTTDIILNEKNTFQQYLDGLNYLVIIYPDSDGKLILAAGPAYRYAEGKNKKRILLDWQKDFQSSTINQ